jgi:TRAP-type transport system periplasmic protein
MLTRERSSKTNITKHVFLKIIGLLVISSFLLVSVFACAQSTPTTSTPTSAPVTTAISTTSTTTAAPTKTIELKLSHLMSPGSNSDLLYQYFASKINERTNGRVKITIYSSGILNPPAQGLDAVKTGITDIVHHSFNLTIGMLPTAESTSLPVPAQSSWVINQASADLASHFQVPGLKELADVHFLAFCGPAGPYYLMTKDKPIHTMQDVKGLKMRSSGVMADMITAWGGTPVSMSTADVYESLGKGVIDGGMLSGESLTSWKLAEPVKYITVIPTYVYGPSILLMNLDKWNSLPKDIQQIFTDTTKDLVDWDGKTWWYADVMGLNYYNSLQGKQLYTIPTNEQAQWDATAQPIIDKYVATYSKLGLQTADYASYLKERCTYWNSNQPDKQSSIDWVKKEVLKQ